MVPQSLDLKRNGRRRKREENPACRPQLSKLNWLSYYHKINYIIYLIQVPTTLFGLKSLICLFWPHCKIFSLTIILSITTIALKDKHVSSKVSFKKYNLTDSLQGGESKDKFRNIIDQRRNIPDQIRCTQSQVFVLFCAASYSILVNYNETIIYITGRK